MARRFVLILAVALVLGLLTASMVYQAILGRFKVEANVARPTKQVAVAAANINLGERLTSQHVKLMSWPVESVPGDALGSVADVEGRVALASLVVGEPLLDTKLASKSADSGILSMIVPENLRGVTIKVDDAVRESGFVSPNSRVDLIVTIAEKQGAGGRKSKVILQNIPVLAAGQSVEMRGNKPVSVTTVTLALTPDQSERLALAKTEGQLMLATRKLGDDSIVQTRGTNVNRLLDVSPAPAPARRTPTATRVASDVVVPQEPLPESYSVVVFHGSERTEHKFVQNGSHWVQQGQIKIK
ncbi:MAG: Flp pilus assembly protein CpaB [Deltaproteobacteria bacterium]|nr:Flp pilus assembly protein CpaB [Deltaproteobacteria bacterium]